MIRVCGIRCALRAVGCTFLLVPVLASCTRHVLHSPYIKNSLADENYAAALERLENINNGSSALLYLYEKGLILHYQGELEESNRTLQAAEDLYFELYTKSLSREVASLVTSDNIIKYRGERYEAAMIYYYTILNYLLLGDPNAALVEWGRELGADYLMGGEISQIIDQAGSDRVVYYQVDLQLIDLEKNTKVWLGQKKIKKLIERAGTSL